MEQQMKFDQEKEKSKRHYEKPLLRVIELAAEEVLAVGCKLASSGSAFGWPTTCIGSGCSGAGS